MKKFLIVLGCLIGFAVVVVLCYFFGFETREIVMPEGKYYLIQIRESFDENQFNETKFVNSQLYLQVFAENKVQSFSGETGFLQEDEIFDCKIHGTG